MTAKKNSQGTHYTFSLFRSVTHTTPHMTTETWDEILARFSRPLVRQTKGGALWSPATFKKQRRKQDVVCVSMLVLDVDGGLTLDEADEILRNLGALAFLHTTYSHQRVTPEHATALDCFRIVIALAEPVEAKLYARLWFWAEALFQGIDPACKDPSRIYYLPAIASKQSPFVFQDYHGKPLNWATIDLPAGRELQRTASNLPDAHGAYIEAAIRGEIEKLERAPVGARNDTLNKAVWNLARLPGSERAVIESALFPVAERIGLTQQEIKATFKSAYSAGLKQRSNNTANGTRAGSRTDASSQTTRRRKIDPIDLVLAKAALFHDPEGRQYASIKINSHIETRLIKSEAFALWVCGNYFEETGAALESESFGKAIKTVQAIALYKGAEKRVHLRVAEHGDKIYFDLCNDTWQVVEIGPDGWRICEAADAPVLFTRRGGMLPLPTPVHGGDLHELRAFINCEDPADEDSWALIAGWLAMYFHPRGPYPILSIGGEQGSGKSTTSRLLQRLVDPNAGDLRGIPKDERDLMIAANNCRLLAYDNLSGVSLEVSDRLCRISTGAGFGTRTLHTNDEETIFAARRPILVNGIADIQYPDFLDRNLSVYLRRIDDDQRRDEKQLWANFLTARPRILGALLSSVSQAVRNQAIVKLERKPRMADFALWAVAAESGLGLSTGTFINVYEGNRAAAHEVALDASPAIELREFMDSLTESVWRGKPSDLWNSLNAILTNKGEDPKEKYGWPQTARKLSSDLRRVAPNLRAVGYDIDFGKTNGRRFITITKKTKTP